MASPAGIVALLGLAASLFSETATAYYLPGSFPNEYRSNATLRVKVNSLTSTATELPYAYYTLPLCQPAEGVKNMAENLGEMLLGDRIENSPYVFQMHVEERGHIICTMPGLTAEQTEALALKIKEDYRVNMILDNMPVTTASLGAAYGDILTGFPLGFVQDEKVYINNHLMFNVLVHKVLPRPGENYTAGPGYMVVGFEVMTCSVASSRIVSGSPVECGEDKEEVVEGKQITYTFGVTWELSETQWVMRWDAYLKMEGSQVHWFSILNSFMVVCFLSGIIFVIMLKTVRRDLTQYEEIIQETPEDTREDSGWKLVSGDVFRAPRRASRLCMYCGSGVQIMGMVCATIIFAAFGFMSPASRGSLLTSMVVLYLLLGIGAGYSAVRLLGIMVGKTDGWKVLCWQVACFFPGTCFIIMTCINILLWHVGSSGAVPLSVYFSLIFLWFCISVPLTLV